MLIQDHVVLGEIVFTGDAVKLLAIESHSHFCFCVVISYKTYKNIFDHSWMNYSIHIISGTQNNTYASLCRGTLGLSGADGRSEHCVRPLLYKRKENRDIRKVQYHSSLESVRLIYLKK